VVSLIGVRRTGVAPAFTERLEGLEPLQLDRPTAATGKCTEHQTLKLQSFSTEIMDRILISLYII
jgi:hypothetical protein